MIMALVVSIGCAYIIIGCFVFAILVHRLDWHPSNDPTWPAAMFWPLIPPLFALFMVFEGFTWFYKNVCVRLVTKREKPAELPRMEVRK